MQRVCRILALTSALTVFGYIIITYCYMHIDTSQIYAETANQDLLRKNYSSVKP